MIFYGSGYEGVGRSNVRYPRQGLQGKRNICLLMHGECEHHRNKISTSVPLDNNGESRQPCRGRGLHSSHTCASLCIKNVRCLAEGVTFSTEATPQGSGNRSCKALTFSKVKCHVARFADGQPIGSNRSTCQFLLETSPKSPLFLSGKHVHGGG